VRKLLVAATRQRTDGVMMRIKLDRESDTLYFRLDEERVVESEEVWP